MKKLCVMVVVAVIVAFAGSAMALDIGGAIKNEATKAATDVAKGQLAKEINKDLAGVSCNYNAKTKAISGCDLKKIAADLAAKRKLTEKGGSYAGSYTDFDILIHTKEYDAYSAVDSQMKNYGIPGWDTQKENGAKDKVTFSVDIK